ncbi:MAG: hypothetical protein R2813_05035 [Flavobacteriales bacterium]
MKSIMSQLGAIIIASVIFSACSSQRYVSSETDDIYYSASDRYAENNNEFNTVKDISGEDYKSNEPATNSEYFSVGKEQDIANPNSGQAYQNYQGSDQSSKSAQTQTQSGATINNFYGSTDYYEGDYYDDSYATRIRRFNSVNVGLGYSYYDPYYTSPYWNYGWSYWNPYPSWSIGYNSWTGWNVGYNWGWGGYYGYSPYYYGYRPAYCGYGYYSNWYSPYYGGYYGNYWGGSYWNGYNNGYYDGFYNSSYYNSGAGIKTYSRKNYNGKAPSALGGGFSEQVATSGRRPSASASGRGAQSTLEPKGTSAAEATRPSGVARPSSGVTASDKATNANSVYQVAGTGRTNATRDVNTRSETVASNRYNPANQDRYSSTKYDVHGNQATIGRSQTDRGQATRTPNNTSAAVVNHRAEAYQSAYSGSGRATYTSGRTETSYHGGAVRESSGSTSQNQTMRPSATRGNSPGYSPANNDVRSGATRTPSTQSVRSNSTYQSPGAVRSSTRPSAGQSRGSGSSSTRPSSSGGNYSAPRSSSPSPNYSVPSGGNSRSGATMSSPSRSSAPSSGGSSSRRR